MKLNAFRNGWMSVTLIAAGIPLTVVALVQAAEMRDIVSSAATTLFAYVLMASLACNMLIALIWRRYRSRTIVSPYGVPLVQGVLLAVAITWVVAIHSESYLLGIATSVLIVGLSIAVFAMVVIPGPHDPLPR